ncbi:MAG: hypothetical protein HQK97_03720 [Nitrospirae bacterium]|nr:hypothetical protein [Nitrospirota bacterium]
MPIYEYQCTACGAELEQVQKITDEPLKECPSCGGQLKKLISSTTFVLKGTGWYVTDYASKDRQTSMASEKPQSGDEKSDKKPEQTSSETASSESKSETVKPESTTKEPAGV